MSKSKQHTSVDEQLLDPFRHFNDPMDVANAPDLDRLDKLRILRSMEQDAYELSRATSENMAGGETQRLDAVLDALDVMDMTDSELERFRNDRL
jgi:hypothetical protein